MPDPADGAADLVRLLRDGLADRADERRAPQMAAYMKSSMPYRGVPTPVLRPLVTGLIGRHPLPDREAWRSTVLELWDHAGHREERYAAIELTGHRLYHCHQDPEALDLYRHLVVTGAWWDLVDPLATRRVGPILAGHRAQVTPVVRAWADEQDLWLRRTAILAQLHHGATTDLALLRDVLEANLEGSRHGSAFFVRKAVGWALRQHARTDPDWVRAFVAEHHGRLSGLSTREALKHL